MRDVQIVFALGSGGAFFVSSPTTWFREDLPSGLGKIFDKTGGEKAEEVYDLVLGDRDSYWVSWRDADRKHRWAYRGLPEGLTKWFEKLDDNGRHERDMKRLRIVLGPHNASYWASDGHSAKWKNLPDKLMEKLTDTGTTDGKLKRPFPSHVALGVHDSWVLVKDSGRLLWSVSKHYPGLHDALEDAKADKSEILNSVALDQHDGKNFLLTTNMGNVFFDVVPGLDDVMETVLNPPKESKSRPGVLERSMPTRSSIERHHSAGHAGQHHSNSRDHSSSSHHGAPAKQSAAYKPSASYSPASAHSPSKSSGGSQELIKTVDGVLKIGLKVVKFADSLSNFGGDGGDGGGGW